MAEFIKDVNVFGGYMQIPRYEKRANLSISIFLVLGKEFGSYGLCILENFQVISAWLLL